MNLTRICIASLSKPFTMLAFSKIWFKSSDFHQAHDFQVWFSSSSSIKLSNDRFRNLSYRWNFFCRLSNACEIDTQVIIIWLILIKFSILFDSSFSDFHQVHGFQVWFSSSSSVKLSDYLFRNLSYRWNFFFACRQMHTKTTLIRDCRYYKEQCFDQIKSNQIKSDQIKSD
jgi:hypothetical protein